MPSILKQSWMGKSMEQHTEIPKDLGVKIGSKTEAEWTKILNAQEAALINSKMNQEIAEMIIERAKINIAKEKGKFTKL